MCKNLNKNDKTRESLHYNNNYYACLATHEESDEIHIDPHQRVVLNSGCSYHTLRDDTPLDARQETLDTKLCGTPTGEVMKSSEIALISHEKFPEKAKTANHYPDLKYKSLFSVGQFCDAGFDT